MVSSSGGSGASTSGASTAINFLLGPGNESPLQELETQGLAAGIYADNGLAPAFSTASNGGELASGLIGGSADFALLVPAAAIPLTQQGECLQFLTGNNVPYLNLVSLPDFQPADPDAQFPESIKNLKGHTIGITSIGGSQSAILRSLLAQVGLQPTDITEVAVGSPGTAVTALQERQIDILLAQPPAEELLGEGGFKVIVPISGSPDSPIAGKVQSLFATTCDYASAHPEVVKAFCTAQQQVRNWALDPANIGVIAGDLAKALNVDAAAAEAAWKKYVTGVWPESVAITEDVWEAQKLWTGGDLPPYSDNVNADCQQAVAAAAGQA
ncbi:ABC transporter substrate-binding protein [Nakamurella alba]|uniref:ABC transporter substrate-binding protein n=1 Tax=Nakamurella alba TaxID=2665158 RepID=UPI0012B8D45F|nr:ABC transporter substrate-binding protein [Nakamurella alba]